MGSARTHWDTVYKTKAETAVSWYQPHATRSLHLIKSSAPDQAASVIDVGGGTSTLIDGLLACGFADVTVLDIAQSALDLAKSRVGRNAGKVSWIVADVTRWTPVRTWAIWHDRAVFHFLTERSQQDEYLVALKVATEPGATAIISTFALDGPETCSGLPVQRYSPAVLASRFGDAFVLTAQGHENHLTPRGSKQRFCYAVLKRMA
ncbi:MAG: class I SAM-dependent methyltransferase [Bradyrhizobium sp.]|nr:class I SAM-dependent methyltransferase [Bradyrhizobium sp.]